MMGIFEGRSEIVKYLGMMSLIVVVFGVFIWGVTALSGKYIMPNRIQDVVLAEVSIGVEATGIEEGVVRANAFCDGIKSALMEQGVEPRFVRIHSVEIARSELGDDLKGTLLLSVRRQNKVGHVDVDGTVAEVRVEGTELVSFRSGVKSPAEHRAWLHSGREPGT